MSVLLKSGLTAPMSKHTPGPWNWEGSSVRIPNYHTLVILDKKPDARLIAAAPDLLFSLKALTLFLKDRTETSHLLNVAMEQARAAIAKAEGTS
jgi:hypothetical protein